MKIQEIKKNLSDVVGENNLEEKGEAVLVKPGETRQVAEVVKWAAEKKVKISVVGGETGLNFKPKGTIHISLENMNKILEIDYENMIVRVQAGMVTADFQNELKEKGLYFPPGPVSSERSTLGGNIACRASGTNAMRHGQTVDFMLGIESVLPSGEILRVGGKNYKDVACYDLARIYGGSRGRMGIITELLFKVLPYPEKRQTVVLKFDSVVAAAKAASHLTAEGIIPHRFEIINGKMLEKLNGDWPEKFRAEAVALIEEEGFKESIEQQMEEIKDNLNGYYADFIVVSDHEADLLWNKRVRLAEIMTDNDNHFLSFVVDPVKLPQATEELSSGLADRHDKFGFIIHGSSSHIHPVLFDCSQKEGAEIGDVLMEKLSALGGNKVKNGLSLNDSSSEINSEIISGVIRAFDPDEILVS